TGGDAKPRAYGSTSTVCRGPLSANSGDPGNPLVPPRSGPAPIPSTTAARPAGGAVPCGTRGPGTPPAAGPLRSAAGPKRSAAPKGAAPTHPGGPWLPAG